VSDRLSEIIAGRVANSMIPVAGRWIDTKTSGSLISLRLVCFDPDPYRGHHMSVRRKLLLALSTATVAASALVFAAPPAFASGENCDNDQSWDTCISVEGSGNYIQWAYGFSQSDTSENGARAPRAHRQHRLPARPPGRCR